ncbi:hypothetical protein ACI48J_03840 [Paenibacillus chitinolyticus]|uniref:hypothetical protein n=1 Tax=Paenibacillus chitinolyticus TaxID=79263 RepID=UPI003866425C
MHFKLLILLTCITFLSACNSRTDENQSMKFVGLVKDVKSGKMNLSKLENNKDILFSLNGISYFILKDSNGVSWIPIEKNEKGEAGSKVILINNEGKVVKELIDIPLSPIKVIEGPNNIIAVLCSYTGYSSIVVFFNKNTLDEIERVEVKGSITDAVFDEDNLYISSDNLELNKNSYVHKFNLINKKIDSTNIAGSLRINSIIEKGEFLYVGVLAYEGKDSTSIVQLKKNNLDKSNEFMVSHSPFHMKLSNDQIYILHLSYSANPIYGGLLTVLDTRSENIRTFKLPILAENFYIESDRIIFTTSFSDNYAILNLLDHETKVYAGAPISSNLIKEGK